MMQANTAKQLIVSSRKEAQRHIDAIINAQNLTREFLYGEIFEFIRCKFLLSHEDCITDDFDELARLSLSKSMKVSKELVEEFDMAKSCDGVSSVMAKKVLLFMSVQKNLNITLPAGETAEVKTVGDISNMVWKELQSARTGFPLFK